MKLKQSKNWWQSKDLNWFIENADFAFTNNGHKGNRVRIVTKEKLNGMNCFEFDGSDGTDKPEKSLSWIYYPKTMSEFISDCLRHEDVELLLRPRAIKKIYG